MFRTSDILINSYKPTKYVDGVDRELSNINTKIYHGNHNLIISSRGSSNVHDIGTNLYNLTGNLKKTNRFKDTQSRIDQALEKYPDSKITLVGHSLGGGINEKIDTRGRNTRRVSFNKAPSKRKSGENYRTSSDLVSFLNPSSTIIKGNGHGVLKNRQFIDNAISLQ